jgi:tellurite resistance protein
MVDTAPLSRDLARPELEAMFEAMFLAAFADDDFSDAERERFARRVAELSGGFVEGESFDELLAQVTRELFTHGLSQRLSTLAPRLPSENHRLIAFQAAAEVAREDELKPSERALLVELGQALELDPEVVTSTIGEQSPEDAV